MTDQATEPTETQSVTNLPTLCDVILNEIVRLPKYALDAIRTDTEGFEFPRTASMACRCGDSDTGVEVMIVLHPPGVCGGLTIHLHRLVTADASAA